MRDRFIGDVGINPNKEPIFLTDLSES